MAEGACHQGEVLGGDLQHALKVVIPDKWEGSVRDTTCQSSVFISQSTGEEVIQQLLISYTTTTFCGSQPFEFISPFWLVKTLFPC